MTAYKTCVSTYTSKEHIKRMLTKHVCRRIRQKNILNECLQNMCRRIRQKNILNECLQNMCVDVYVKRTY